MLIMEENKHYILTDVFYLRNIKQTSHYLVKVIKKITKENRYLINFVELNVNMYIHHDDWTHIRPLFPLEEALL